METIQGNQVVANYDDIFLDHFNRQLTPLKKRKAEGDSGCKQPLVDKWPDRVFTAEQIAKYRNDGHGIGLVLGNGLMAIDVDAPTADRPNKQGPQSFEKLQRAVGHDLKSTWRHKSPTGGLHLLFRIPAGLRVNTTIKDFPGIEFLADGRQVVTPGSPHWQGGFYELEAETDCLGDYQIPDAPQKLIELITRKPVDEIQVDKPLPRQSNQICSANC